MVMLPKNNPGCGSRRQDRPANSTGLLGLCKPGDWATRHGTNHTDLYVLLRQAEQTNTNNGGHLTFPPPKESATPHPLQNAIGDLYTVTPRTPAHHILL